MSVPQPLKWATVAVLIVATVVTVSLQRSSAHYTDQTAGTAQVTPGFAAVSVDAAGNPTGLTYSTGSIGPGWTGTFQIDVTNDSSGHLDIRLFVADLNGGTELLDALEVTIERDSDELYNGTMVNLAPYDSWDNPLGDGWTPAADDSAVYTIDLHLPLYSGDHAGQTASVDLIFEGRLIEGPEPDIGQMQLTYDTTLDAGTQVTLPIPDGATVDATVDWGDGNTTPVADGGWVSHDYAIDGEYQVTITGQLDAYGGHVSWSVPDSQTMLTSVDTWNDHLGLDDLYYAFGHASNLTAVPTNLPSTVTSMRSMFSGAESFDQDLSGWDVSNVTDMGGMFAGASAFNGDVSTWDTSNITNLNSMFRDTSFNSDLSSWDVSNVTTMNSTFAGSPFNGNIGNWATGNVTSMVSMFSGAESFDQDLSGWDVSNVTSMVSMFQDATAFNGDISSWDVGSVTMMNRMFQDAATFDQDLSGWDVSNVNWWTDYDLGAAAWQQQHKPQFD